MSENEEFSFRYKRPSLRFQLISSKFLKKILIFHQILIRLRIKIWSVNKGPFHFWGGWWTARALEALFAIL